jgi:TRAP-type C4-dicarboxylate transport system permease small subunit
VKLVERVLRTTTNALDRVAQPVATVLLALIAILIAIEVFNRYFFGFATGYFEEFSQYFVIWLTYLLAGVLVKYDEHLKVDLMLRRVPKRFAGIFAIVIDLVALGFGILILWASIDSIAYLKGYAILEEAVIQIPEWILHLCIPMGMSLIILHTLTKLIQQIRALLRPAAEGSSKEVVR